MKKIICNKCNGHVAMKSENGIWGSELRCTCACICIPLLSPIEFLYDEESYVNYIQEECDKVIDSGRVTVNDA